MIPADDTLYWPPCGRVFVGGLYEAGFLRVENAKTGLEEASYIKLQNSMFQGSPFLRIASCYGIKAISPAAVL